MTLSYTPRFHLAVPDFLSEPWHAEFAAAMESIDQALFTAIVAQNANLWMNDHIYVIGDIVIDPTSGTLYSAAVSHTSSNAATASTFSIERTLHPTYWTSFAVTSASQAEAEAGVDNSKYMTPLRTAQAITAQSPTPGVATLAQAQEGINNTEIMTPLRSSQGITSRIASNVQAVAGTDNTVLMTPLRTEQLIAAAGIAGGTQIAFSAHKNSVDQTGIGGAPTKITFGTELYDLGNMYDASNSRWTPPAGVVHISGGILASGTTAGSNCILSVYKNGAVFKQGLDVPPGTTDGCRVGIDDTANGTDYYELFVSMVSAGTGTVVGNVLTTYFMGHFLGQVGVVTLGAGQIGFRAHKNSVDQNVPNSAATKVTFGFEDYDQGNYFDTVNSRWVPPTGLVHIDAAAYFGSGVTANSLIQCAIYKNGLQLKQGLIDTGASSFGGGQVSVDDIANGTDYYEMFVTAASGGVAPLNGNPANTFFGGHFLGGSQGIQGNPGPVGPSGSTVSPSINSGRLRLVSATQLSFTPLNGDRIKINGVLQQIPVIGVAGLANTGVYVNSVSSQPLLANTTYYVYVFMNAGVITADFSTTGHATSATVGNEGTEIKIGDDTRSLIGMIRTAGTGGVQFVDSVATRLVLSWFNRRTIRVNNPTEGLSYLPPGAWYEGNNTRLNFLTWGDESIFVGTGVKGYPDGDDTIYASVVVDNPATVGISGFYTLATQHAGWWTNVSCSGAFELAEGFHFMFCTSLTGGYNHHVQANIGTTIRG